MPERVSIRAFLSLALGMALVGSGGCRKHPPPPLVAQNLGTADRPLLPVAQLAGDPDILKGRAAPIRAADISEEELARADEPQDAPDQGGELSEEDADLIEELVGLIATAAAAENYDELGDYLVEAQRDAALTLIRAGKKLDTALADFQDALPDDAGDSQAQVGGLLTDAGGGTGLFAVLAAMTAEPSDDSDDPPLSKVTLVGMKMANSDTAAGSLSANQVTLPVEFALIDDNWYLQLPDALVEPETVDAVNDLTDLLETKINDLTDRLDDGSLAAGDLQGEIATASTEVKSAATELAPLIKRLEALAQVSGDALPVEGEVSDENKELITELVDLFGEAVTDRRFGDLMEFFVPDQQEQAETVYPAFGRLLAASDALARALEDDDADVAEQVRAVAATLAPYLSTEGLGMTGENQAVAFRTVGDRRTRLQFEYIDDDWYYRDAVVPADADQADALAGRVITAAEKIDTLTGEVEDGSVTAAEVPTRIVAILLELGSPTVSESDDHEGDDDDDDDDEGDDEGDDDGHHDADDEGDDDDHDGDDEDGEDDNSNDNANDDQDDDQASPATPPARPGAGRGRRLGN